MSANKTQLIQTFLRTISHDVRHYQALLPLLKKQRELYLTFDADLLQSNIEQQTPHLNALKRSSAERSQSLQQLGLSRDEAGVNRLLAVLPATLGVQAKEQWSTLKNLVEQCQRYNTENGQTSATFHEMVTSITATSSDTYQEQTV